MHDTLCVRVASDVIFLSWIFLNPGVFGIPLSFPDRLCRNGFRHLWNNRFLDIFPPLALIRTRYPILDPITKTEPFERDGAMLFLILDGVPRPDSIFRKGLRCSFARSDSTRAEDGDGSADRSRYRKKRELSGIGK